MPATADTNRASLAYQPEAAWGVDPITPALKSLRFKGSSLMHGKTTVTSEEIRADRQISDLAEVGADANGSIEFELSFLEYQKLFEAALFGTLQTIAFTGAATLSLSGQTVVCAAGTFTNAVPGAAIRLGGCATAGNNGIKTIVSKSVDGATLTLAAGSITADETPAALTAKSKATANGINQQSFLIEQALTDTTGTASFQRFAGMTVDTLSLAVETKKIITGSIGFLGMIGSTASASFNGATPLVAQTTNPVMNGTSNIGALTLGGIASTKHFKGVTIAVKNNLRGKDAIGNKGNFEIGSGRFEVTGTMQAYFADNSLLQAFIAHDYTALSFVITDSDGNAIAINLPRINFSKGNPAVPGINQDVMQPLDFTAILDAATNSTMIVSFLAA